MSTQRVAFIDAPSGVAGDMLLGALLDVGCPVAVLEGVATPLGAALKVERVERSGLVATQVRVHVPGQAAGQSPGGADDQHVAGPDAHGAHLGEVLKKLEVLGPPGALPWSRAHDVFRALADAEARVHGATPESIHFHEVGALDALVDIAGCVAGLHHLGVEALHVGPLPWGRGTISCAHGTMPNPAPATVHLLAGHPTTPSNATFEQVTPTGAALVRVLAQGHGVPQNFVPERTGFGAGTHPGQGMPNLVRLTLGHCERPEAHDALTQLETNIDDTTGEVAAYTIERLLALGARDAWASPLTMKKGRPGLMLGALVDATHRDAVAAALLAESGSLGLRQWPVHRTILPRESREVQTTWGPVRVKQLVGKPASARPEYEDCAEIARREGLSLREVMAAARDAAARREATQPPSP